VDDLPKKILVATDGSAGAETAARRAAEMARALGSELHVVHVIPVTQPYHLVSDDAEGPSLYEEDSLRARELLERQVNSIETSGAGVAEAHVRTGEPDAEIVSLGEELDVDLIVVGSRGLSSLRRPIGSVSSSIVAHAHCPVLVIRDE
jgi:nucleotide-binding universal stress UspA family protein